MFKVPLPSSKSMADVLLADEVYHEVYYQGEWIETAPHPALSAAEEAEEHRFLREHFDEHYDPFDPYAHTHNWLDFVGALKLDRLHGYAVALNYARAVSLLIAAGAALDYVEEWTNERHNALAYCRRADIAEMLLDAGADIELRDGGYGYTPLEVCLFFDRPAIARVLLSRGADVDAVDLSRPQSMPMRCYQLLRAMRAAGSWRAYVDLPRQELLAFRRRLLDFRRLLFRRAFPPTPSLHERLFFEVPEDVFRHVFTFWRGPRDLR